MSLLSRKRASASVRAVDFCDTCLLSRAEYEGLVDTFPLLKEWIKEVELSSEQMIEAQSLFIEIQNRIEANKKD